MPVIILLGVVMPFLTFLALGMMIYTIRKPRTKVTFEEGPRVAEIGPGGDPIYPVGLPHCRRDMLVYPSGTVRCERCRDELAVICPMCDLGRPAIDRHLHQLRPRPEGQPAGGRRPHDVRSPPRRRGGSLSR